MTIRCNHLYVAMRCIAAALAFTLLPLSVNAQGVGIVRLTTTGDQQVPVAIWYPSPAPTTDWDAGPYRLHATRDAPPAAGRHALIVLSHGSGGSELGHADLAEALARAGYIIAAPGFDATHYGLTWGAVDAEIHGIRPDGSAIKGVEVLRLAYAAAGLGAFMRPTGWAPLRPVVDAGYRLFARHRRRISAVAAPLIVAIRAHRARRTLEAMHACRDGACDVYAHRDSGSSS